MERVTFWTLDSNDRRDIERLTAGLGRKPARVLTFLVLRANRADEPATGLEIRIGTDLNRKAATDALERLEERGLVARTTIPDDSRGRPPKAWRPTGDRDAVTRRAYDRHAVSLLRRAAALHRDEDTPDSADERFLDRNRSDGSEAVFALGLNWQPNGLHAPFYAAHVAGHYEERGVEVRIQPYEGSRRALDSVVRGDVDAALAGAATVIRAREADEPICPVAIVYQRAMTVFYAVREQFGEELTSVDQFRDRRIGMPGNSETGVLGRLFLSQTDIDDSVQFVDTGGEERRAVLSGEADIVTGSFADPRELAARGLTVDSILVADRFPIYGLTLAVRADALEAQRAELRRFLAGTVRGWVEARRRPDPAVEAIAADGDDSSERARWTFERAREQFGESEAVREHGWGWQRAETWERLGTALEQGNLLRGAT